MLQGSVDQGQGAPSGSGNSLPKLPALEPLQSKHQPKNFIRVFKKHTGVTPGQFRDNGGRTIDLDESSSQG